MRSEFKFWGVKIFRFIWVKKKCPGAEPAPAGTELAPSQHRANTGGNQASTEPALTGTEPASTCGNRGTESTLAEWLRCTSETHVFDQSQESWTPPLWKASVLVKIENHYLCLAQTAANSVSLRLSWASASRLNGGLSNGSLGVGVPSASSSTVSTNSEQCSGSVPRRRSCRNGSPTAQPMFWNLDPYLDEASRRSCQNCASPTVKHSKPFKHLKAMDVPNFRKHLWKHQEILWKHPEIHNYIITTYYYLYDLS